MGQTQSFPPVDYDTVSHFTSAASGKRLHSRSWVPQGEIRALVYFCHGVSEHMEWYTGMAEQLNSAGVAAFGHDHVGHGRSEGDRVHVESLSEYIDDIVQGMQQVKEQHADLPMFLLGHSMGGLIAFLTAAKNPGAADYLILSAPALIADPETATPFKIFMAQSVAGVMPQLGVGSLPREFVCRDQKVLDAIDADTYFYHGPMKAGWACRMLDGQDEARELFESFSMPLLIYHGTVDKLCLIDGSRQLFELAKSEDKTMKEYEGGYHKLDSEPDGMGEEVKQMVADWVVDRAGKHSQQA